MRQSKIKLYRNINRAGFILIESSIVKSGNTLKISINGKVFEPLSFKSFRPTDRNVSDFYKAGIRLFCVFSSGKESATKGFPYSLFGESWIDEYSYDFTPIDNQLDFFIKNAPEAYFMLMIQVDTRDWWLKKHPEYSDSFWELSKVAADEKWRKAAAAYIDAVIEHVEKKYPDKIYCYFIMGGCTTEWFSEKDFEGYNAIKEKAYKAYVGNENAVIPSAAELERDGRIAFIDPIANGNVISYRRFHNELIADTLLYFADGIRAKIGKKRLIGVYFGYVMELGGSRLWNAGSIAYEKVFNSDSIDIIVSPSAYTWCRRHDGTSAYMTTADTLSLNNKLYFLEFDQRTYLKSLQLNNAPIDPAYGYEKLKTEQDTIDVMRRDFMLTITKGIGIWWFDMFEGWYYSENLMKEISRYKTIATDLTDAEMRNNSEIAFIVDPESFYYVNKNANLNGELLTWERCELAKLGAPYDIYSLCDLEKIDFTDYKLIIFPTLFKYNEKIAEFIEKKLKRQNKTILFMYAPFYVSDEGYSFEHMNKITEMEIKPLSTPETVVNYKDMCYGFSWVKDKMFYVFVDNDFYSLSKKDDLDILGRYQCSYAPALVRKNKKDYSIIFSGSGCMRSNVLRDIALDAGVHIYSYDNDNIVFVNDTLIGVYHRNATDAEIYVKKDGIYRDLFSGKEYVSVNKTIKLAWSETETAQLLIYKSV